MNTRNTHKRSAFSMIELVFVIVILGVLAAVAVPRFVATRTDAQVATARSDAASAQKAIVAKVFADNIDPTQSKAPDPNKSVASQGRAFPLTWGEWIVQVAGLDGSRWKTGGKAIDTTAAAIPKAVEANNAVEPIGNTTMGAQGGGKQFTRGGCAAVLGIETQSGYMVFAPNNIATANSSQLRNSDNDFCYMFMRSYQSSGGVGNKIVPLASSGTVEF